MHPVLTTGMASQSLTFPVMEVPVSTPVPIPEEASTSSSTFTAADFSFLEALNHCQNLNTINNHSTADEILETALHPEHAEETAPSVTFDNTLPPVAETPEIETALHRDQTSPEETVPFVVTFDNPPPSGSGTPPALASLDYDIHTPKVPTGDPDFFTEAGNSERSTATGQVTAQVMRLARLMGQDRTRRVQLHRYRGGNVTIRVAEKCRFADGTEASHYEERTYQPPADVYFSELGL